MVSSEFIHGASGVSFLPLSYQYSAVWVDYIVRLSVKVRLCYFHVLAVTNSVSLSAEWICVFRPVFNSLVNIGGWWLGHAGCSVSACEERHFVSWRVALLCVPSDSQALRFPPHT